MSEGNLALFCDFENIALGVRDAKYDRFDIRPVLERLLVKGSIVVKKAYCDWDRYKEFKPSMHEAAFEMIEIPHVRQSGKNSADIRMVVDALDLCYTKEHIDTFVIISGDSDFSPLVSKLRENAKTVIGVGVKNSTSDLLMSNCDEFIFYDDLVRQQKKPARRRSRGGKAKAKPAAKSDKTEARSEEAKSAEELAQEGIDLVLETADALYAERGEKGSLWGSMVKQTLKRRRPGFNESFYGFSSFSDLLEEAQERGELQLELDEKSGGYIIRSVGGD
ncbi:MAG: NYN domain-containing protein [Pseudomonadales bacterium]